MKKLFMIALIGSFSSLMIGCQNGGSKLTALEYNDAIIGIQMQILTPMMKTMELEGADVVADLKATIATTEKSIDELKNMAVYKGGEEMKTTALDLFNFYLSTMKGPWMEACVLFAEKGENMNEEEVARFQELLSSAGKEEVKYDEAFGKAQNEFAKANKFEIERNAMQDEIDGNG